MTRITTRNILNFVLLLDSNTKLRRIASSTFSSNRDVREETRENERDRESTRENERAGGRWGEREGEGKSGRAGERARGSEREKGTESGRGRQQEILKKFDDSYLSTLTVTFNATWD